MKRIVLRVVARIIGEMHAPPPRCIYVEIYHFRFVVNMAF